MKKLIIILVSVTMSFTVSAQKIAHGFGGRGGYHYAPRSVYVVPSFSFGYGFPYYSYPFYGYGFYGYGYPYFGYPPYYAYRRMPSQLSLQIQDIRNDYQDKIRAARKDKTLSRSQRRQQIRTLKSDREKDILSAEMNFRQSRSRMNNGNYNQPNSNQNNKQNPGTNNQNGNENQNNQNDRGQFQ